MKAWCSLWLRFSSRINMPCLLTITAGRTWFPVFVSPFDPYHSESSWCFQCFAKYPFWSSLQIDLKFSPFPGKFLYFYHAMMPRGIFIAMILLSGKITSRLTLMRKGFPVGWVMVSMTLSAHYSQKYLVIQIFGLNSFKPAINIGGFQTLLSSPLH